MKQHSPVSIFIRNRISTPLACLFFTYIFTLMKSLQWCLNLAKIILWNFDTWGGILKNMFDAERSPFHASLFAQLVTIAAQFFSISSKVNVAPFLLWLFAFFRMGNCFCRRFFLCGLLWWGHRGLLDLQRHHRQRTGDEGGADGHEQGRWSSWRNLRLPFSTESRGVTKRFG